MPKYKPVELQGNEHIEYAVLADMCAARCSRLFITPGDLVVKSNIDTFHHKCAVEWCNARDISQSFRAQHINELDLEAV